MPKFKTWLDRLTNTSREHYFMPAGEKVENDYKEHFDENSVRALVVDGQRNTYDEIQSHRDSVDINLLVKRYMNGDFTALDRSKPVFMDLSLMPQTLAAWKEVEANGKRYFYSLDPDTRALFNNSYEQFVNQIVVPNKVESKFDSKNESEVVKENES